ncbi:hypothetical protein ACFPU1_16570 [Thalassorhabdus alkalitolerans]|uniref:Uncharacterized protein n=1 Tax=Thalassorhabdus alkalitolerans TaxID=2282697 RepID=A0ABW0YRG0_9BACI
MTDATEVIRFDCVGDTHEPHIVKCNNCNKEFRAEKMDQHVTCSSCRQKDTLSSKDFEVVGVVRKVKKELTPH